MAMAQSSLLHSDTSCSLGMQLLEKGICQGCQGAPNLLGLVIEHLQLSLENTKEKQDIQVCRGSAQNPSDLLEWLQHYHELSHNVPLDDA